MSRAIDLWHTEPMTFRQLAANGMRRDYAWNLPGKHYINIYDHIRHE